MLAGLLSDPNSAPNPAVSISLPGDWAERSDLSVNGLQIIDGEGEQAWSCRIDSSVQVSPASCQQH